MKDKLQVQMSDIWGSRSSHVGGRGGEETQAGLSAGEISGSSGDGKRKGKERCGAALEVPNPCQGRQDQRVEPGAV